ncbi:non-hydrolyzing UDP-N-acetylglucosamine 2-epimerase [Myroides injenensis]|uniref:non-hydrolyzing UDP-N-acetylglucosamine 2-epimerase n=1 Tax=Myroides injenensis TaxID=1183151 RepID=UPI0002880205|nr:UDP-N-acetylglucosamine 2-epimerase (non-hydrolyzing) [Myroides injenensis]
MEKKKILFAFGTRPEAIKMAPLIKEFKKFNDLYNIKVCTTGQHKEMLDQVLDFFSIEPDYDLAIMQPKQTLTSITSKILLEFQNVLDDFKPDFVFVHGDTTTSMAAGLATFYSDVKLCHVEAGLRTFDKKHPFPEEINRRITGVLADFHFAPTEQSKTNLLKEKVSDETILVTGNTVIDALLYGLELLEHYESDDLESLKKVVGNDSEIVLVTGHRRENHGEGFINICEALKRIAINNPDKKVVYPVHLNPNVLEPVTKMLSSVNNIHLIKPLSYPLFIWLMNRSKIILTDSGGIQEEAPSLGKPVLVMRNTTERPEAIESGTVKLVGTDQDLIYYETNKLLNDSNYYAQFSNKNNPYGNGRASKCIVDFINQL